jgi:hypothetical protein
MGTRLLDYRFALSICGALLGASAAQAQASRTWVSGVGDDVNPCSRTAPCKTFSGAISKTFINGEIDVLDPGGFGTINITKSMTLDGTQGAGFGSILSSGVNAVIVNIAAGNANDPLRTVRLRNLALNGTGASGTVGTRTGISGIRILSAAKVYVENVIISDFSQQGINDERATGGQLFVADSVIRNNGANGVLVQPSNGAVGQTINVVLNNVKVYGNGNVGVFASFLSKVTAINTDSSGNSFGFFALGGSQLNLESCLSAANNTGVQLDAAAPQSVIRLSNCAIMGNNVGVAGTAANIQSFNNNKIAGNNTGNGPGVVTAANPNQQ